MKFNKKIGVITAYIIGGLYLLFLILPFILSPIVNSFSSEIETILKETTGFDSKIQGLGVVTTPKLTAGFKVKFVEISAPADNVPLLKAENLSLKVALLPLIFRNITIDSVCAKDISVNLTVKRDGSFLLMDYLPSNNDDTDKIQEPASLPFGLKLSDKLPNISIKNHKLVLIDSRDSKSYFVQGEYLRISDFKFNKSIKISTEGKIIFADRCVSNYSVKLHNYIMPETHLHDLVFPETLSVDDQQKGDDFFLKMNIIDIFKLVNKNMLKANLEADVKTSGSFDNVNFEGHVDVNGLSAAVGDKQLPESYFILDFNGEKTLIDSVLYSSFDKNELTKLNGTVKFGKKPSIVMDFKSNARFNNLLRIFDSIAQSIGNNDLKTISATGGIDADFSLKSDLSSLTSNGFLKIEPSSLHYGLYNIDIKNILADINFEDNNIKISNSGFSVFGQPLKLSGSIDSYADVDLKLIADKLSLKGLIAAIGQNQILKDNIFNSGTLSLNAIISGRLNSLNPDISVSFDSLNIYNRPSAVKLLLNKANTKIKYDNNVLSGDILLNALSINHPQLNISIPNSSISLDSKDVNIKDSYLLLGGSKINFKGLIKDYTTDKMFIDMSASGNLSSLDISSFIPKEFRCLFPYKGAIPVSLSVKGNNKSQDIITQINANPSNYFTFANVDLLKNKNTNIYADLNLSGDNLSFKDVYISNGTDKVLSAGGSITKLYSNPTFGINILVPKKVSFPIWGLKNSNISATGEISVLGSFNNPKLKGNVNIFDISDKDLDFVVSDIDATLDGSGIGGPATAKGFKFGGITAQNISGRFLLKDYNIFSLYDLAGKAFDGDVRGKLSYNISKAILALSMKGEGLNSMDAVYGASGIKKALTGSMDFDSNLQMQGYTDKDMIKSLNGNINFVVKDGRFISIGRLENLVAAQNVASYSILKAALSKLSTFSVVQESDKFKSLTGALIFKNGIANISKIDVVGQLMSYHVSGTYNILPNTAKLTILGRLDSKVVSCLGVLGELSADKLLSYIPTIGPATAKYLSLLTANPDKENVSLIPALASDSKLFKDFKVEMNGVVGATNSVKSFKWLSKCDTSKIDIKKEVQNAIDSVKNDINTQITTTKNDINNAKNVINNAVDAHKKNIQMQKESVSQTVNDIKNIKENAGQSVNNLKDLFKNAAQNSVKQKSVESSGAAESATSTSDIDNSSAGE